MVQYNTMEDSSVFRVLGIAMVVDQLGKGPRMILRYPTVTAATTRSISGNGNTELRSSTLSRSTDAGIKNSMGGIGSAIIGSGSSMDPTRTNYALSDHNQQQQHQQQHSTSSDTDLFHRLSGRQMAKLFRPKRALCGQPITLTIDDTYFCCCAVLLDTNPNSGSNASTGTSNATEPTLHPSSHEHPIDSSNNSTTTPDSSANDENQNNNNNNNNQPLVLFSVIVAVAPQIQTSSSIQHPISLLKNNDIIATTAQSEMSYNNPIFPTIRRVHISLSRLCRILEREERRCRYVSCQVSLCEQIRRNFTSVSASTSSPLKVTEKKAETSSTTSLLSSVGSATAKDTITESGGNVNLLVSSNKISTTIATANSTPSVSAASSPISNTNNIKSLSHSSTTITTSATSGSHRRSGSYNFSSSDISSAYAPPVPNLSATTSSTTTAAVDPMQSQLHTHPKTSSTSSQPLSSIELEVQEHELEQVIMETILTAPPTRIIMQNDVEVVHAGNLVQELIQVYYALARCTDIGHNSSNSAAVMTSTPPNSLLTGQDSVVYVNRHIAVVIEAVAPFSTNTPLRAPRSNDKDVLRATIDDVTIRPYMTLLFPHVSPDQILESLNLQQCSMTYGAMTQQTPRRMQQLLRIYSPKKSLLDMSKDMYVTIEGTMDVVTQLVRQGLCIISPVVLSYNTCFVSCNNVQRLDQMKLPFYQQFGTINLFLLVSYITEPNRTMNMCLVQLVQPMSMNNVDDTISGQLRESISNQFFRHNNTNNGIPTGSNDDHDHDVMLIQQQQQQQQYEQMKDIVYEMIVWLCSHQVIVPLQDYIVVIRQGSTIGNHIPSTDSSLSIPAIQATSSSSSTTTTTRKNFTGNNTTIHEERKYEGNNRISRSTTGSSIGSDQRNNNNYHDNNNIYNYDDDNNNNNNENDVYIWESILCPYLSELYTTTTSNNNSCHCSIMECCYITGIDELVLRTFIQRNMTILRIVSRPTNLIYI